MEKYIRIPMEVLNDENITSSAKLLLGVIISFSNNKYQVAFANNARYARALDLAPRTITRLIKELKDQNYIIVKFDCYGTSRKISVNYSHERLK